jgi:hypothetical protein
MRSLADKEFHVEGNWYAPKKEIEQYSSVVKVLMYNTTSSAGDWQGIFIQKMGKKRYDVLLFSQENCFPNGSGFNVHTSLFCQCQSILSDDEICKLINILC